MLNRYRKILTFLVLTCTTATAYAGNVFSHAVLTLLDNPRIEKAWSQVISTQAEWEDFYNQPLAYMSFVEGQVPVAPQLDFEKYQVLAGGLGMQSHGGSFLTVKSVQELERSISVHVLLVRPGKNCIVPAVISYPSTAILVKKTDKPFSFSVSNLVNECIAPTTSLTPVSKENILPEVTIFLDESNTPPSWK